MFFNVSVELFRVELAPLAPALFRSERPGLGGGQMGSGAGDGRSGGDEGPRAGGLADSVVNSALRYRAQAPFVDSLLKEIGISPSSITSLGHLGDMVVLPVSDDKGSDTRDADKSTGGH